MYAMSGSVRHLLPAKLALGRSAVFHIPSADEEIPNQLFGDGSATFQAAPHTTVPQRSTTAG